MRERIARALARNNGFDADGVVVTWPAEMLRWQVFLDDADTALNAMREPTPEISFALSGIAPANGLLVWQTAIAAARGES